ncbi:hypothetical protein [Nonomuraea sp. NPDC049750]|uniref:hypothetical protein n=1 Tax=Nonomuraea sp. NPDC049750 TaxID=3154738 RepID=UPI0033CFFB3E
MGLDIYLYTRDQEQANNVHDKASEAFYEREDWASESERKAALEALPPYATYEKVASEKYPDHLFGRRYLRSSYNGSGFNRAVPDMVGKEHDLSWIFEPVRGGSDEYSFELTEGSLAALEQAKARALQVAAELGGCDPLRTMTESGMVGPQDHLWSQPPTEEQVLDWYRSEKAKNGERDDTWGEGYSNGKGTVLGFKKGLEVLAVTLGRDILGRLSAVIVYRSEALDSYIQSAEIVAEFCDEALSLIKADGSCFMHWSG